MGNVQICHIYFTAYLITIIFKFKIYNSKTLKYGTPVTDCLLFPHGSYML